MIEEIIAPAIAINEATVSGTLIDLGGNVWTRALIALDLVPPATSSNPYLWGGGQLWLSPRLTADGNGYFFITLPSNSAINPQPNQWRFTIRPSLNRPPVVFTVSLGSSPVDISSAFTANSWQSSIGTVLSMPIPIATISTDVATPASLGSLFYDTTAQSVMFYQQGTILAPPGFRPLVSGNFIVLPNGWDVNAGSETYGHAGFYFIEIGAINTPGTAPNTNVYLSMLGSIEFFLSADDPTDTVYFRGLSSTSGQAAWGSWFKLTGTPVP